MIDIRRRSLVCGLALILVCAAAPDPRAQSGDTQAPSLVLRSPGPGSSSVSTQIVVKAMFSEPVVPASISFVLRDATNAAIAAAVSYDDITRTATLNPDADLTGANTYTATVSGATDAAGNSMPAPVAWSFTTATEGFQQSTVISGLTEPTEVEFAADGRVFVAEKSGIIKVFDSLTDTTPTVFADLSTNVHNFWDRGMLGLALHPNFPAVPYVYVLYSHDAPIGGTAPLWGRAGEPSDPCPSPPGPNDDGCVISARLSRLEASGNTMTGSEVVLLEDWFQQFPGHSIGDLAFGPDGALYAGGGDGASYTFVDYGQAGTPRNPGGDPPVPVGGTQTPPTAEGGALRAQDLETMSDPVRLNGAIVRISPETAAALPDNPLIASPDVNARRIIAYGLRNPYRFTIRPGTSEIWIGDVGWQSWEEINRIVDPADGTVENFGWPCYEGNETTAYGATNLAICTSLYGRAGAETRPYYAYEHSRPAIPNDTCGTGSSSISGVAFYSGTSYPTDYRGALLVADYSRGCIWMMSPGTNGLPDPSTGRTFLAGAATPVELENGPGGDIFYVDHNGGTVRRIRYFGGNQPPTAAVTVDRAAGPAPLTVTFDASGSFDPEGALSHAWDLDGDGEFDDGTDARVVFTYTALGTYTAQLRVTDGQGLIDLAAVSISVGNSHPAATIVSPTGSTNWSVGETISFSGVATDPEEGSLPPSSMTWTLIVQHCPESCHSHVVQSVSGVASGSFVAPDHDYPSHLELRLSAQDAGGLSSTATVALYPRTVALRFETNPAGLEVAVGASTATTPFTRTVMVGSANSISAPAQILDTFAYAWNSWSDGGAQTHNIIAGATPTTYTANLSIDRGLSGLVAAYGFDDGSGTAASDASGNGRTGTLNGAAWTPAGRFGGALTFDGINDWVTVADVPALDFTTAFTIEAWVYSTAPSSYRTVVLKENGSGQAYGLYAHDGGVNPGGYITVGGSESPVRSGTPLGTDAWVHLALTYDGATLRLYRNGVQVGSTPQIGSVVASAGPLRFGGNGVWNEWFQGRLDEIRLYNRALSASAIQIDMNTPVGVPGPDTTAPTVSVTGPGGGVVAGAVTISATATDDVGVASVQFKRDGVDVGSPDTSAPFSVVWDTSGVGDGAHVLTAVARDAAGNEATSAGVSVTVDNTAPAVEVTGPSGTVSAGVTVTATASDPAGVVSVQFRLDGAPLGAPVTVSPYSVAWDTTGASNGDHTLTAVAVDSAGNQRVSDGRVVTVSNVAPPVDTTPPAVSVSSPLGGDTVSGTISVAATATDNVGVTRVQFKLDGVDLGAPDTTQPFSVSWTTGSASNGPHVLTAVAEDAAGNSTLSAGVSVTVSNSVVNGLVAAYGFNESSGTTATDASGNGRTGTVTGATWTTAGRFGGALTFDGINDWVTVADGPALDFTTAFTIEAWVYSTLASGYRTVALKESSNGLAYALYAHDGGANPSGYITIGGTERNVRSGPAVTVNTWTHLALTYDGTTLRLYRNGVQSTSAAQTGSVVNTTQPLRFGGNGVWNEWFRGRLDEIRLYNRALTAAEIQTDMNTPVANQ